MSPQATSAVPAANSNIDRSMNSQEICEGNASNELVLGVVGHIGSGNSTVAEVLQSVLAGQGFDVHILKARKVIARWAESKGEAVPKDLKLKKISDVSCFQDLGDNMRKSDLSAVALGLVNQVRNIRAKKIGHPATPGRPVPPDGHLRAYILDSLRHPAEAQLLRTVYGPAFALVGVVCQDDVREKRLTKIYEDGGSTAVQGLMKRDAKAPEKHGQRVSDTYELSDFFIDNSVDRFLNGGDANKEWDINDQLSRLVKIFTHAEVVRPLPDETAMHAANGAKLRSACLSRQVGACLTDQVGRLLSIGTNEVPKAGGGIYTHVEEHDGRCAYRETNKGCSNVAEQKSIIDELLVDFPELTKGKDTSSREALVEKLLGTKIGSLLEFSRAVHAEMEALLAAARGGVSTVDTRMYVTTFPCHYCARHLVGAGVAEVQYIEPYPKSRAFALHRDSITRNKSGYDSIVKKNPKEEKKKVVFRPFTGVAPRLYERAFLKDRELKDKFSGKFKMSKMDWPDVWSIGKLSYVELEAKLTEGEL